MSELRRYDIDENGVCTHQLDGAFVSYEDYARLKAEVERLTAFTTRTIIPNEELQAQVEELTKELKNTDCMFAMASAFARDWNAAKEGKGQP